MKTRKRKTVVSWPGQVAEIT